MNQERRAAIDAAISQLEEVSSNIDSVKDDEQSAFDNMPESLQQGDRGQAMEEAIREMDEALESVRTAIDSLDNAKLQ